MKTVPSHILGEIKRYDPLLNLRWSREKRKYVLERKTDARYVQKPIKYGRDGYGNIKEVVRLPEYSERYIQYHSRHIPVAFFDKLDRRVLWFLFDHDSYKIGVGRKFTNELEYREKKAEQRQEQKDSEYLRELGAESYRHMKYKGGERMSFHG